MQARQDQSWMEAIQQPPKALPPEASHPRPVLVDDDGEPITTAAGWQLRRSLLRSLWQQFLGSIPGPGGPPVPLVLEEDLDRGVRRQLIRYEAEPGIAVEAYLLTPRQAASGLPGVVVLHSTVAYTIRQPAGLEGPEPLHLGWHFASRGYAAICPRCFLWQHAPADRIGDAVSWLAERHPGVLGMAKMLFDAMRAVDLLTSLPQVDPSRIGAVGHSLGAKEVLYLAAFDLRIRAAVFSEGGIDLGASNWDAPWYLGPAVRHPGFPLDHGQLLALAAPRAFLIIGGDSADGDRSWPSIEAVLPVWKLLGNDQAVGLWNHRQGHPFPALARDRSFAWLERFLQKQAQALPEPPGAPHPRATGP